MAKVVVPADLGAVLDAAWAAAREVPGFLTEAEARFLGIAAACSPATGAIVEIGSFKGRSTVMLAKVAEHYGLGRVVAIDPHNFNNTELRELRVDEESTTFNEFQANVRRAGVEGVVDARRAYSGDVAREWTGPVRFLWIDGDHSYAGAKTDFDGFLPWVQPGGVVALHDALHQFAGPIRVFVEEMLASDRFGAAGFVGSIAWAQFRPGDGARFAAQRAAVARTAAPLARYQRDDDPLRGVEKLVWKIRRSRVKRAAMTAVEFGAVVDGE